MDLDEVLALIGKLYIDNIALQKQIVALQAQIAELEKEQQGADEQEDQSES